MGNGLESSPAGIGVVECIVNRTRFRHPTAHDDEVFFLHGFVHDLLSQQPGGFGIFAKNQYARSGPVKPMNGVHALPDLVAEELHHKHVVFADSGSVHQDSGRLVDGHEMLVGEKDGKGEHNSVCVA